MSAVETIQAAIERLETLRDKSTPRPWTAMEYDSNPGDQGVPIIGGGEIGSMDGHLTAYTMTLGSEEQSVIDAELIVILHRTIDAQLEILQECRDFYANSQAIGMPDTEMAEYYGNTVALAAAILGEES